MADQDRNAPSLRSGGANMHEERIGASTIVEAILTTIENARSEGEPCKTKAEDCLGAIEGFICAIGIERQRIEVTMQQTHSILERLDTRASFVMQELADGVWQRLGCPEFNPVFEILFPSSGVQDKLRDHEHSARLDFFVTMFERWALPVLDVDYVHERAAEVRAIAVEIGEHEQTLRALERRIVAVNQFEATVVRMGLLQLSQLRRSLRALGVDDAVIKRIAGKLYSPPSMK